MKEVWQCLISSIGAASFTIYTSTKEYFRDHKYLNRDSFVDAALVGGTGGAISGALISFGSARKLVHLHRPAFDANP